MDGGKYFVFIRRPTKYQTIIIASNGSKLKILIDSNGWYELKSKRIEDVVSDT